jgi:arylsulfatase A-like enzyme
VLAGTATAGQHERPRKPNIVFILADDLGWAELGCYGNAFNETPNLDRLARDGLRLTDAYAAAPVCSPYRAALMTGQWPARIGITDYLRPDSAVHLPTGLRTLPESLREAGYATGIVGKWHLTGYANHGAHESPPNEHGFDEVLVSENRGIAGGSYFHPYHFNREIEQRLPDREYLVDRCNNEAVEFIERHKHEPFFLYLSHYAVHTRLNGTPNLVEKYVKKPGAGAGPNARRNNPHLAAQLESIDAGVGMIRAKLDELGLADTTIVVFTSDNGGEDRVTSNAPLRAGKSTLYEGGIRVPAIILCPGVTKSGSTCRVSTRNVDWYPTLLACAGVDPDRDHQTDGVSLVPVLADPEAELNREALFWHYPLEKPHFLGGRSSGAIRAGTWKLIEFFDTDTIELYDLAKDIGEEHDLSAEIPEKTAELRTRLREWRVSTGATMS